MELLIATGNHGKAREFRDLLGGDRFGWRDLSEFRPQLADVPETGSSFRANACLKAMDYARQAKLWTLADDSGLEVDALGGNPGIYSARWATMQKTGSGDADNNATLLRQLESTPDELRTARFVCVLALANPQGRVILTVRDTVEGRILRSPRGENGFGYDPLFWIEAMGRTTAELARRKSMRSVIAVRHVSPQKTDGAAWH